MEGNCVAGLNRVATALQNGELARAMISALLLRLDDISEEKFERLDALAKTNFNSDQPRDRDGRWTTNEAHASTSSSGQSDHPALVLAQVILPFGARPPLFFENHQRRFASSRNRSPD